ncbi:MAG: hypothetical protein QM564_00220 [Bergeyella sp.]
MKKTILFFLLVVNFYAFAQDEFYDKTFGLKNKLEQNELRIYVSKSYILFSGKAFVLKQNKKGKWKAKWYQEMGNDNNIYVKNFRLKNGAEFWENIVNNKPKADTTSITYIDPDFYTIHWNINGIKKKYFYEEPLDSQNKNDEKMKTVYHFFEMIQQKFGFKFND